MTLDFNRCAKNCGAPAELWRKTRMSACRASRLRAVSVIVSPLVRLDVVAEMLITSALRRNAASSNDVRVRVLGSTKKLTNVLPRNAGTFLISRVPTCLNASVVSRTKLISSAINSRSPIKSLRVQRVVIGDRDHSGRSSRHSAASTFLTSGLQAVRQHAERSGQHARVPQ